MTHSIELEKTYLCPTVPSQYISGEPVRMIDVYVPAASEHPSLRLRQKGNRYEITRKKAIDGDPSRQREETIELSQQEFDELASGAMRRVEKRRIPILYRGAEGELDIFGGEHEGLVLVDFEFATTDDQDAFEQPDFCQADVTREDMVAGGILSGLTRNELFTFLARTYGYEPVDVSAVEGVPS